MDAACEYGSHLGKYIYAMERERVLAEIKDEEEELQRRQRCRKGNRIRYLKLLHQHKVNQLNLSMPFLLQFLK
jgi:hypothetical protein